MKASEQVKAAGLKSLAEVSEMTGQSAQTLINWSKNKPDLFKIVIAGCKTLQTAESHWWCPHCDLKVHELHVTFNQRHTYCGNAVRWVNAKND